MMTITLFSLLLEGIVNLACSRDNCFTGPEYAFFVLTIRSE